MSNIRPEVRSIIKNVLESQDGYHSKVDVLRAIEEEAMLMKETQYTVDMIDSDPMEQFSRVRPQIEHLKRSLQVRSCSRVRVTNNYCKIDAVVGFEQSDNNLQLTFRYERKRRLDEDGRTSTAGFHIRYSIEMSINHQQRENLVVVEVWTDNNWPSIQKAVCVNAMMQGAANDDDDGWEDIEEDENGGVTVQEPTMKNSEESSQTANAKRQRLNEIQETGENGLPTDDTDGDGGEVDSYLAHLDPDVLHDFLELAGIKSKSDEMHEATAFFLLMTFPFYEQEWDLVGFLLDEIFGDDEEEE
jgi:hypothetical protein